MAEALEIVEVPLENRRLVERFIRVPWFVNREHAPSDHWVPPLLMDRRDYLNPKKNPFWDHADGAFWIARRGGKDIGRVAAVHDRDYVEFHHEKTGYLGMFECANDPEAARALLEHARAWLKGMKLTKAIGPLELSTNYMSGALVDGFDRDPGINMPYNPPYYDELLTSCGYEPALVKARDLFQWEMDATKPAPERITRIAGRIRKRRKITIRTMDFKRWDEEVLKCLEIYNDAWEKNWGFVPLSKKEFLHIAKDLKMVLHPSLAIMAEVDDEPVAFVLSILNVNPALKKINGRLLPTGIFRLLWDLKVRNVVDSGRLILLGIKAPFRGQGIDTLMFVETLTAAHKLGFKTGEIGWTLEDNRLVNRAIEAMGGYKVATYRVYEMTV